VVEGSRFEIERTGDGTVGSNPTLSETMQCPNRGEGVYMRGRRVLLMIIGVIVALVVPGTAFSQVGNRIADMRSDGDRAELAYLLPDVGEQSGSHFFWDDGGNVFRVAGTISEEGWVHRIEYESSQSDGLNALERIFEDMIGLYSSGAVSIHRATRVDPIQGAVFVSLRFSYPDAFNISVTRRVDYHRGMARIAVVATDPTHPLSSGPYSLNQLHREFDRARDIQSFPGVDRFASDESTHVYLDFDYWQHRFNDPGNGDIVAFVNVEVPMSTVEISTDGRVYGGVLYSSTRDAFPAVSGVQEIRYSTRLSSIGQFPEPKSVFVWVRVMDGDPDRISIEVVPPEY
jgi:hypothetical protein